MVSVRLSTGCPPLDHLLEGGLERGAITQVYGEPGSGKSSIILLPVVASLKAGSGVIFFDTEGFSVERFRQIAGKDAETLAERLYIYEPFDFDQQGMMIRESEQLFKRGTISLYVLDSATALYRTELGQTREAQRRLASQMMYVLGLSRRYRVPVLITNQVYMDPESGEFRPLGGPALQHLSKTILRIERRDRFRRLVLIKHRSLPEGGYFDFQITGEGIEVLK